MSRREKYQADVIENQVMKIFVYIPFEDGPVDSSQKLITYVWPDVATNDWAIWSKHPVLPSHKP